MQGLGNDFVVIDCITQSVDFDRADGIDREKIQFIANRRFGIGCDQVLLIESPRSASNDFYYRIFNANGTEVEQCGNGARCLARYVLDKNLTSKDNIKVETISGVIELKIGADDQVIVNMGEPHFDPKDLPMITDKLQESYILKINGKQFEIGAVSMGNPHAVMIVDNVDNAAVGTTGKALATHSVFPQGVNVGFMEIISRDHINLRVFERGVGETLACGTGACAAVAIARSRNIVDANVEVELKGGHLSIHWDGGQMPVLMTGPAKHVFEGSIQI